MILLLHDITVLIIIAFCVFIVIQLNQHNMIRDDNIKCKINDLNYISVEDVLQLLETQQANCERKIKKLNQTLYSLHNQSINMIHLIELSSQNIENNTNMTDIIASIQTDYLAYQQRTNWISGVVNMPHIIPYSFNELANEDKDK
eukprot:UN09700